MTNPIKWLIKRFGDPVPAPPPILTRDIMREFIKCNCKPFSLIGDIPGEFRCEHCGKLWGTAGPSVYEA